VPDPPVWLTHTTLDLLTEVNTGIAPVSAVAVPALMAAAARHPNYLTQGLWPIAPLAQPNVLRLGESLPVEWRAGTTLFARRLARAGFGPALTHPDQPATFTHAMTLAMRTHAPRLLRRMRERSILADLGYLDPTRLPTLDDRTHSRAVVPPLLYDTLAIEAGLRAMIDHQPVPARDYA
jgi:asparagine synthase (glutamine-hydrolysing)